MLSTIDEGSRDEWRRDLEQIKSLGFNTVRTWVEWAHCEPGQGEYDLRNLKLLCELAADVGLRVIVQLYVDSAPDWVGRKYPDALFEAQSGEKVPSQAAPGYCTDHPGVRAAMAGFLRETARTAAAYPNLHAWDLWSEPHIVNWAIIDYVPNAQFCFCPHTRARFRGWLSERYDSIERLNAAWYRQFDDWSAVEPPRFGTILSYTDFIDWKTFIYEKLAEDLLTRKIEIRGGDPKSIVTSHAAVPSLFTAPFGGAGISDDFLMADSVDYYGTSLYPKHSFPDRHWPLWRFQVAIDFSRSANRQHGGFYVGELQAGFGTRGVVVGNPVTPEDLRLWMWSVLAGGARAINLYAYYPMSSGYESGGYGLVELDGKITARAEEAGRIARLIHERAELLLKSKPVPAQVAILYNPLSQMVGGEQQSGPAGGHGDSLMGYWRVFSDANVPVDFVHRRDLESGKLGQYRLLIVPYAMMLTQTAAAGLKSFVEAGGCAVAEARLAWNDERGYASEVIPGMGLSEVFGVRETSVAMRDKPAMRLDPESTALDAVGASLTGAYFAESVERLGGSEARVVARWPDESAAIVMSRHGNGRTLFIGSFLGLAQHQSATDENRRWILSLLDWADIEPPFRAHCDEAAPGLASVKLHEHDGGRLLFVINHDTEPRRVVTQVRSANGAYLIHELTGGEQIQTDARGSVMTLAAQVPARDARVFDITLSRR